MPHDLSFNMADTLRLPGFSVAGGQGSLPGGYKNLSLQNATKMDRSEISWKSLSIFGTKS